MQTKEEMQERMRQIERTIACYARVYDFLSEAQVEELSRLWDERMKIKQTLEELRQKGGCK